MLDSLFGFSIDVTSWLQANYPQLAGFLALISNLGRVEIYLAFVPLVYWCIDKQFGKHLAYLLALTNIINAVVKHLLREPRPYWLVPDIGLADDPHYGIPSGHAQAAATFYLMLAIWARRPWVWAVCALMIFLMGLSRVYLGVHFIHDVISGFLLGSAAVAGYVVWQRYFHARFRNRILGQRLLVVVLVPLIIGAIYLALLVAIGRPSAQAMWSEHIIIAEAVSLEESVAAVGGLLGLGVGFVLEASRVHFVVDGSIKLRAARYVVGIIVTLAIWVGLGAIFPDSPAWLALPLRLLRYTLVSVWVAYYAPVTFVRFRLAQASSTPDIQLTVSEEPFLRG